MNQALMARVSNRAKSAQTRTDQSGALPTLIQPVLTAKELSLTIREVGFEPSPLYVELMQTIGNGGFGPGYGLMGLVGGATDDMGNTAVGLYTSFAQPDSHDPAWKWPYGMLPICHWGCAIYSCIDCTSNAADVMIWDPNTYEDGTCPTNAIYSTEMSLSEWLLAWSEGIDLWDEMYPSGVGSAET